MIFIMKIKSYLLSVVALLAAWSCSYREYAPADYPGQVVYLAASTVAEDGIIYVDSESDVYTLSEDKTHLSIHLGVVQSGVELGNHRVYLNFAVSKVNFLIDDGTFAPGTLPLPKGAVSFPEYVDLTPKDDVAYFDLSFNTIYLTDPEFLGKKFVMALEIMCDDCEINPDLKDVIFVIDPKILM